MEAEDEGLPFLKYCNENPGNYLLQNGYDLQDSLPGDSILTEIANTGTWQTEFCPILVNSYSLIGNENSALCRNENNKSILQPISLKEFMNGNFKKSQPTCGKEDCSENNDVVQKLSANTTEESDSPLNTESSIIKFETDIVVQNDAQERNILSHANRKNCVLNSLISSDKQYGYVETNFEVNERKSKIRGNIVQVLSPDEEKEECTQDNDASQYYFITTNESDDTSRSNIDTCLWEDFYSILTAMKCKVCSFLCERIDEMNEHMKKNHRELMILKEMAGKENGALNITGKMKSLLNTNQPTECSNGSSLTLFICSCCNKIFATREILMDHITRIHRGTQSSTSETIRSTETGSFNTMPKTSMRNLATALLKKQKREMGRVRCSVSGCFLKFASDQMRTRHEKCHASDKKLLQCPLCKEKFSEWSNCSKHLWTSHGIDAGLYTCPICNKYKSNSPVVIMNHMDIHYIEKPFICAECGKCFKQLTQLRNHAVTHKKDDNITVSTSSRKCTICERYFANPKSLKIHIQSVHEKLKPYVCNICGHKTARKAMLELHLRQHTGDKPYHCSHCTYKTGDHNCLRRHIMWHYGCMKYFCPYCKYQSIQSSAYKNHLANRHPEAEITFKCNICSFTSVNSDSYLTHVKIHHVTHKETYVSNQMKNLQEKPTLNVDKSHIGDGDETHLYLHLTDSGEYSEGIVNSGLNTSPVGFEEK